ncbi:DUF11 domain-containing protein [Pelagibaculum spongiae]|uniref:DUF11 domain-containing protein n=1 Tax=Pelagibaculum spongiae TaxID=2080658 RepID=A0A2V1H0P0_9GAMM|nr:DUF11 domain-containing protein [Pelagibaculum spongiae]PVZ68220.1 hypothetical protein DC094_13050 [Pelagibaculum spongiae]
MKKILIKACSIAALLLSNSTYAAADLSLSLSGFIGEYSDNYLYVSVDNRGSEVASNVQVSMPLNCSENSLAITITRVREYYNCDTGVLTFGNIASDETATRVVPFNMRDTFNGSQTVIAQVSSSSQPDPDSTPNNNLSAEDDQASLTFDRSGISYPALASPTITITTSPQMIDQSFFTLLEDFTVTVTNTGAVQANRVRVNMGQVGTASSGYLPIYRNRQNQHIFSGDGIYDINSGIWDASSLAPGESKSLSMSLIINILGNTKLKILADGLINQENNNNVLTLSVTGQAQGNPIIDVDDTIFQQRSNSGGASWSWSLLFTLLLLNFAKRTVIHRKLFS